MGEYKTLAKKIGRQMEPPSDLEEIHQEVFKLIENIKDDSNKLLDKAKSVDTEIESLKSQFQDHLQTWQKWVNDAIVDFRNKYESLRKELSEIWQGEIDNLKKSLQEFERTELEKFNIDKKARWERELKAQQKAVESQVEELNKRIGDLLSGFEQDSKDKLSDMLKTVEGRVIEESESHLSSLKEMLKGQIDSEQQTIAGMTTKVAQLRDKIDQLALEQTELSKRWKSENKKSLQIWENRNKEQLSNLSAKYQSTIETLVHEYKDLISKQEESGSNLIASIKERNDQIENILSTTEKNCSEIRECFLKGLYKRSKSLEEEISVRLKNSDQSLQESFNLMASDIQKAVRKLLNKELKYQRFYWREFIDRNRTILDQFKVLHQSFKVAEVRQNKRHKAVTIWIILISILCLFNGGLFLASLDIFNNFVILGQRIVEFISSFIK
jgi:hypothetical protein